MIEDRRNKRVIFASVFKEQETILLVTNKSINDKMKDKKEYVNPLAIFIGVSDVATSFFPFFLFSLLGVRERGDDKYRYI